MQEHGLRPRARQDGLVVQELGDESLVYDRDTDVAHCLSATAARVWRACDGQRDLGSVAALTGLSEDLVSDALVELSGKKLLADGSLVSASLGVDHGVSRRQALKRIAGAGLAATSLPLIVSATAGTPLAFASGITCTPCSGAGQGTCTTGFTCDPAIAVCIPDGCAFAASGTCTPNTCPGAMPLCNDISCGHICCAP
jgi:hypothetical protein